MTFRDLIARLFDRRPTLPAAGDRPPREDYVRVTIQDRAFIIEPAVEWREGDAFDRLASHLENTAIWNLHHDLDAMGNALAIGAAIAGTWPGRAYFVEVWQEGKRGFAQCVQPYGFPRNR